MKVYSLVIMMLSWVQVMAAVSYDTYLQALLDSKVSNSHDEGRVSLTMDELKQIVKRDEFHEDRSYGMFDSLPDLDIHTFDNGKMLSSTKQAAVAAYHDNLLGDFFYLWEVINHNGRQEQLNDLGTSELAYEIGEWLGEDDEVLQQLINTSTCKSLKELYEGVRSKGVNPEGN